MHDGSAHSTARAAAICRIYGTVGALLLAVSQWASAPPVLLAADWPQILGPHRNGRVDDDAETLPSKFPERQLTPKFTHALGAGYAGPAIVGQQVVIFHRVANEEVVEALDAETGKRQWRTAFPTDYAGGFSSDTGPRCVPLVHEGRVYVFGAKGRLHCLQLDNGTKIWSRDLASDYAAPDGYFGAGSTPILAQDRLIVHVGGRDGAAIVALSLNDGTTLWTAAEEQVSYASPTTAMLNGARHYLFLGRLHLVSIDPADGTVRFTHPFGARGLTVTATTPVVIDQQIFLSASYGIGAELLQVQPDGKLRSMWANDETLSSQYTNSIAYRGHLYGTHGREDSPQRAELRCVEAATGRVCWSRPNVGVAHLIGADDKLLMLGVQTGELVLLEANPEEYHELDRQRLGQDSYRALPAYAGGVLYLRTSNDDANRGALLAYPLRK